MRAILVTKTTRQVSPFNVPQTIFKFSGDVDDFAEQNGLERSQENDPDYNRYRGEPDVIGYKPIPKSTYFNVYRVGYFIDYKSLWDETLSKSPRGINYALYRDNTTGLVMLSGYLHTGGKLNIQGINRGEYRCRKVETLQSTHSIYSGDYWLFWYNVDVV